MNRFYPPGFKPDNFWHWLAVGFGSGLAPKAPGTFGSLAALVIYLGLQHLTLIPYLLWLTVFFVLGVVAAQVAGRSFQVHDHSSIVVDEFVGQWLGLLPLIGYGRQSWWLWLLAFAVFRFFDIRKPWPICWLDKQVGGGWGVMLDDVAAGAVTALVLWVVVYFYVQ